MSIDLRPPPTPSAPKKLSESGKPPGSRSDRIFRYLALGGGLLVFVILALIAWSTTKEAWPAFTHEGISFITSSTWDPNKNEYGALALIYGTLVTSVIALVFAVPISFGIALFVTEIAPGWLRRPVTYVVDLLATIPSVVFGLWGIAVLARAIPGFYQNVSDLVSPIPGLKTLLSGDPISGASLMTAGLILALMIVPIVTAIAREVFATVPFEQKEAAYGLGATRWEMIRGAMFPYARSGLVAGTMIGLGRALGETIAVALVVGSNARITAQLFSSGDTMAGIIANQFGEAGGLQRSALIGLGVVLFVITILVGIAARWVVNRTQHELNTGAVR
jgi:phosphate transport system permease protein